MATPLLIGPNELAELEVLRGLAAEHPINMPEMMKRIKKPKEKRKHKKQMTQQTVYLPADYSVTFSIETGHPVGTCRHMSMAVDHEGRVPNQYAVWMVAQVLGFVGSLEECAIWPEELEGRGRGIAINIVQPLNMQDAGRD